MATHLQHLAKRKELYEALHPETRNGGAPGKRGGGKAKNVNSTSFVADTAKKTKRSRRTIEQDVRIATARDQQLYAEGHAAWCARVLLLHAR